MGNIRSEWMSSAYWTGWRYWAACFASFGFLLLLGLVRATTDTELAFSSFALLPVMVMAWVTGQRGGLLTSTAAAVMWVVADLTSHRTFSAEWVPYVNGVSRFLVYGLVGVLTAQVEAQFESERLNATLDFLTGLENRRSFIKAGEVEETRAKRYARSLAVIFIDLDDFKALNDAKGHEVGDAALKATAKALLGALRSSDRLARLGGDEFGVFLPEVSYPAAIITGQKIHAAINKALKDFSPATVSVGIAWFESMDRSFPKMLEAADDLMYQVKAKGKNNVLAHDFKTEPAAVTSEAA